VYPSTAAPNSSTLSKEQTIPRLPKETIPVALAYLATSFAFGVSARQVGLSFFEATLMSVIMYAGSAQMIALGLITAGASVSMLVATTFLVNLRHLLMSASLCPNFREWKSWQRVLFGCQMTDETFAVISTKCSKAAVGPAYAFRVNHVCHFFWITGTVLGHFFGGTLNLTAIGLDYAIIGMLLALWVMQIRTRQHFFLSVAAGGLSLAGTVGGLSTSVSMLIAAVTLPTIALIWRKK